MPDTYEEATRELVGKSAVTWRKSTRSQMSGNCVEVARLPGRLVGIRDSQQPRRQVLRFTSVQWNVFVAGIRDGEFDR